jgi:hypothetical protein
MTPEALSLTLDLTNVSRMSRWRLLTLLSKVIEGEILIAEAHVQVLRENNILASSAVQFAAPREWRLLEQQVLTALEKHAESASP